MPGIFKRRSWKSRKVWREGRWRKKNPTRFSPGRVIVACFDARYQGRCVVHVRVGIGVGVGVTHRGVTRALTDSHYYLFRWDWHRPPIWFRAGQTAPGPAREIVGNLTTILLLRLRMRINYGLIPNNKRIIDFRALRTGKWRHRTAFRMTRLHWKFTVEHDPVGSGHDTVQASYYKVRLKVQRFENAWFKNRKAFKCTQNLPYWNSTNLL